MLNLFTHPPRLPLVAPSIMAADYARMGEEARGVLEAGADLLHLDVMDGHFVPNLTMGPDMCRCLRRALPDAFLDVHLMVTDPGAFVAPFVHAGANHLTFHVEVAGGEVARRLARQVRHQGASVGLALNPSTAVETVLPYLGEFDLFLVMSVQPGFSGQRFMEQVLDKAQTLRARAGAAVRIQIDGGITPQHATLARRAGCDVLVAASAVFGVPHERRGDVIDQIRGATSP